MTLSLFYWNEKNVYHIINRITWMVDQQMPLVNDLHFILKINNVRAYWKCACISKKNHNNKSTSKINI